MMRKPIAAGIGLLLCLSACTPQPGLWVWRHPDPGYARENKGRDIAACEQYALVHRMDGPFSFDHARDYGGWGDFSFEFCMEERGWRQTFEKY